ncbi:hypothetical protein IWQ60_011020 [Tieghemiomyces parasiticus]|uniref:F-box domain-containing protein n=1 Tax=Tieghemiomyces parasiticus TaxID=78921 RepID=A0A9W7ZRG4_9FUNG|nr:hypothetical protein IWQ60_011020 [Tieghemiomyces parasiticus]
MVTFLDVPLRVYHYITSCLDPYSLLRLASVSRRARLLTFSSQHVCDLLTLNYYTVVLRRRTYPIPQLPVSIAKGSAFALISADKIPKPLWYSFSELQMHVLAPVLRPLLRDVMIRRDVVGQLDSVDISPLGNMYRRFDPTVTEGSAARIGTLVGYTDLDGPPFSGNLNLADRTETQQSYPRSDGERSHGRVLESVNLTDPDFYLRHFTSRGEEGRNVARRLHSFVPDLRAIHAGVRRIPLKVSAVNQLRVIRSAVGYAIVAKQYDFLGALLHYVSDFTSEQIIVAQRFFTRRERALLGTAQAFATCYTREEPGLYSLYFGIRLAFETRFVESLTSNLFSALLAGLITRKNPGSLLACDQDSYWEQFPTAFPVEFCNLASIVDIAISAQCHPQILRVALSELNDTGAAKRLLMLRTLGCAGMMSPPQLGNLGFAEEYQGMDPPYGEGARRSRIWQRLTECPFNYFTVYFHGPDYELSLIHYDHAPL